MFLKIGWWSFGMLVLCLVECFCRIIVFQFQLVLTCMRANCEATATRMKNVQSLCYILYCLNVQSERGHTLPLHISPLFGLPITTNIADLTLFLLLHIPITTLSSRLQNYPFEFLLCTPESCRLCFAFDCFEPVFSPVRAVCCFGCF